MDSHLVAAITLLIGLFCLTFYVRRILAYRLLYKNYKETLSITFALRNQEGVLEGIIRDFFSRNSNDRVVEVLLADVGSGDQTPIIIEKLSLQYPSIKAIAGCQGKETEAVFSEVTKGCIGDLIYCIDMTVPVNHKMITRTLASISESSDIFLYRTKVRTRQSS